MAVNFGSSNTSRYYSVPDNALLTLPNGDWSVIATVKCSTPNTNGRYVVSTNTFSQANSFNFFLGTGTDTISTIYNTNTQLTAAGNVTNAVWSVVFVCRRANNIYVGWCPVDGTLTVVSSGQAASGTSDGIGYFIGARNDAGSPAANRYWNGSLGWLAHVSGYGVTTADIESIASGSGVLNNANITNNLAAFWHFNTAAATITDSINSLVATRQSTGWSDDTEDVKLAPTGATQTRGITIQLFNGASNVGSLTGIQAAFFDQAEPKDFLAPVFKTSTATTDSSGNITLNVDSQTALSIGQNGFLVLYKLDGTDHKLSPALATRATIVNIA